MIITIRPQQFKGWVARFTGSKIMPNGVDLPLPWSPKATFRQVATHLLAHFPDAIVQGKGRDVRPFMTKTAQGLHIGRSR